MLVDRTMVTKLGTARRTGQIRVNFRNDFGEIPRVNTPKYRILRVNDLAIAQGDAGCAPILDVDSRNLGACAHRSTEALDTFDDCVGQRLCAAHGNLHRITVYKG
ncbi:hypothetical protein D3C84_935610 [compost metagenome]